MNELLVKSRKVYWVKSAKIKNLVACNHIFCAQRAVNLKWRCPNHGNGSTEGICSSIFPPCSSMSFSVSLSSDDNGGQSTGERVWRSHSVSVVVVPCASRLDVSAKYTNSNRRKENEIHL